MKATIERKPVTKMWRNLMACFV